MAASLGVCVCLIAGLIGITVVDDEELCNSHGVMARMPRTGVRASYLCYSNCDEIKSGALTIAKVDQ